MSDTKAPNAEQEMSKEEAEKHLADAQAKLGKQVEKAKKAFSYNVKLAQDRFDFACKELDTAKATLAKLEPYKNDPEGGLHHRNVGMLVKVYSAVRRMMELELACHKHNLGLLDTDIESIDDPNEIAFRIPAQEAPYMEARSFLDLHLAAFHCLQSLEGIDAVLRAGLGERAIVCQSAEEESERAVPAQELKAATQGNQGLAILVGQLASELQETLALLEWGNANLQSVFQMPPQAKIAALRDEDWAKINGKVVFLGELTKKVQAFPELARLFPEPEPAPVPYEVVAWVEQGTAPLSGPRTGQTGRLNQSGRQPSQGSGPLKK